MIGVSARSEPSPSATGDRWSVRCRPTSGGSGCSGPHTKRNKKGITTSARSERSRLTPDSLVRIRRVMSSPAIRKTKRAPKTSATQRPQRPSLSKLRSGEPGPAKNSFLRRLFAFAVALGRARQNLFGDQTGVLANRRLDLRGHVGIGLEERLGVLTALAEPLAGIGGPRAG